MLRSQGYDYVSGIRARAVLSLVCMCTVLPDAVETDTVGKEPRMKSAASLMESIRMWLPGPPEIEPAVIACKDRCLGFRVYLSLD